MLPPPPYPSSSPNTGYTDDQRKAVQEKLTRVILRLMSENSDLHYYQGLHDIVITFLLVVDEKIAYAIMNMLVKYHIRWEA